MIEFHLRVKLTIAYAYAIDVTTMVTVLQENDLHLYGISNWEHIAATRSVENHHVKNDESILFVYSFYLWRPVSRMVLENLTKF